MYYIPNLIGTSLNLYTYDLVQLMLIEINIESSEIGFDVFHAIKYQYLVRILKNFKGLPEGGEYSQPPMKPSDYLVGPAWRLGWRPPEVLRTSGES